MSKVKELWKTFVDFYKKYHLIFKVVFGLILGYLFVDLYQFLVVAYPTIDWKVTFFEIFGGLGIFLYGINLMGDSLKSIAGTKLKLIIEKTTKYPIVGILIGILVTGLIQSSSGTTALTVGLVRAGLMTLPQAVGVIIGANIGTTITSFLIGLKIKNYALPIIAAGAFLIFFGKKKKTRYIGGSILGFGMLFFGLGYMGDALKELAKLDDFVVVLQSTADQPILGLIAGAVSTALVQSSSASIGILQELYATNAIPLMGAIAILFGSNIGTTVTAVLASIGGSTAGKRTALAHVLFNVIGSVIFFIFLIPYSRLIGYLEVTLLNSNNPEMTISIAHMGFNIINTVIMYFFIKQLVWLVRKLIPGRELNVGNGINNLTPELIDQAPALALEASKVSIVNMGEFVKKMLDNSINYSFKQDDRLFQDGMEIEEILDTIDKKTHDYLVEIAKHDLSDLESSLQAEYVDTIRDFERIGDHCTNLLQFFEYRYEEKIDLQPDAEKDLRKLYKYMKLSVETAVEAFVNNDKELANQVLEYENTIDKLVIKSRKRHIMRMSAKEFQETQDYNYVDILSNVERIGDHANNIAINILQDHYYNEELDFEAQ